MRKVPVGVALQSLLYVAGGVNHFVHPANYVRIMPDHYADPKLWVLVSGAAEFAGGVGLLLPQTRRIAALGLGGMLLVFLDVHIFMLRHPERFPGIPPAALWVRLLFQSVLVGWAWRYAGPGRQKD